MGELEVQASDLIGEWKLDEFIVHRESGEAFLWPGEQSGTLIYTAGGYVSVAQNRQPLANPSLEDAQRVSNFYTGRWRLGEEAGVVYHTALQSNAPAVIGQTMRREVERLPDGRLKLSGQGLKEKVTLIWSRL